MDVQRIRRELQEIGARIRAGDDSKLFVWVIPNELAVAQRPLRYDPKFGGSGIALPPEARSAVIAWVGRMKAEGMSSIISLMHPKELKHYEALKLDPRGLHGFYIANGFEVAHFPWADPAHAKSVEERARVKAQIDEIKIKAFEAFKQLPKSVLLHCSAGIDRTSPVAAFISSENASHSFGNKLKK